MRIAMLLTFVATLLSSAGCVSAVDDGCTSDSQCYLGRVCVDGRCTGEAQFSQNNEVNNGENNVANNANNGENNVANNVLNNFANNFANNVANNNNSISACMSSFDCDGGDVCTSFDPGSDVLECAESWVCEPGFFEVNEFECIAEWFCEDESPLRQIFCEFGDADLGRCYCFVDPAGEMVDFEASRGWCEEDRLAELANIRCGWQVPTVSF